jgi:sugar lactone lactonase YvrE
MKLFKFALFAASIALITACGGGSTPPPVIGTNAVVTTLAGTALQTGSTDATGAAARFNSPYGVAVDASGNVYVADSVSHTIRKTTSAGVVTTLAGSAGQSGSTDGTGISARFNRPGSVAVDSSGNLYVADDLNNTIRKITPTGVVTTLAGTAGTSGVRDGLGGMARFDGPGGIAVDSSGNLYVSDTYGARIRKITPAGAVTTLAGSRFGSVDGTGASAEFNHPTGVAIDSNGNLYVADRENHTIRKITSAGVVTTLAGTAGQSGSTDATGAAARFNKPTGVAVDASGNVYVADRENHTIRKITSAGVVTTLAGTAGQSGSTDATGTAARFRQPHSVYVDPNGNIYVADLGNRTIRKITMTP